MFAYLKGIIEHKEPFRIVIDCGGVGYDIEVPMRTYENAPDTGNEYKLYIHFSMNDESIRLFGFSTISEKKLFRKLISISRIGPKIGISILSALSVDSFIQAVHENDTALISTVPGLGIKSAQRIVMELRDKLDSIGNVPYDELNKNSGNLIVSEAENALTNLGYKQNEIKRLLSKLVKNDSYSNAESLIKASIKELYKNRSI